MTDIIDLPSLDLDDIERLDVRDGDTVLVRSHPTTPVSPAAAAAISEALNLHRKNVTVLVVPAAYDIARLDEDQMEALGWFRPERRKPARRKRTPKPQNPETPPEEK